MANYTFVVALAVGLFSTAIASAQSTSAPASGAMDATGSGRSYLSADALWWTFKDSPTPVPIVVDFLGEPGTNVLLGGGNLNTNPNTGVRLTGGFAVNKQWGMELTGFYFSKRSTSRGVSSSGELGSTDLLLPFFDVTQNAENFTEISFSPLYSGSVQEELTNSLWGVELNGVWPLAPQGAWQMDLLGGLRYLKLRETYTINTSSPYIPPLPVDIWLTSDAFDTTNSFIGAQIGLRARYDTPQWYAHGTAKVALGAMQQQVDISGSLVTDDYSTPGNTQTFAGGYFALPSNIGNHSRSEFSVLPEIALTVGYRFTSAFSVFVGYTALYASNVVRPGQQINRNINPTQSVSYGNDPPVTPQGPVAPTFNFNTTDFWAQGVSAGLAIRF